MFLVRLVFIIILGLIVVGFLINSMMCDLIFGIYFFIKFVVIDKVVFVVCFGWWLSFLKKGLGWSLLRVVDRLNLYFVIGDKNCFMFDKLILLGFVFCNCLIVRFKNLWICSYD